GFFLGRISVEESDEPGQLQDFVNVFWNMAQLQIATGGAGAGQQPHQCSQSAAVDEDDLTQVQENFCAIAQQLADMFPQYFGFTGHDAPTATDDGDRANPASIQ